MTIDEVILHAEEVVEEMNYEYQECVATQDYVAAKQCGECAEKHRQLAEWLKDYKRLLDQVPALDKVRAEIEQLPITDTAVRLVCDVIDKYISECEDK